MLKAVFLFSSSGGFASSPLGVLAKQSIISSIDAPSIG
jgi:hypothetical protein